MTFPLTFISGCFHHPGCCVEDSQIPDWFTKLERWNRKKQYLQQKGRLITIRECQWKRQVTSVDHIETTMGRILNTDTESTLLKAIEHNKIWGFAVCDIETPEEVRREMTSAGFLFPPVIRRMEVDETMMSEYMKKRFMQEHKKMNVSTVVQCFNAKQELIMTPLLQKYMQLGMKVSNITRFIQFQPGKALDPFAEKVYRMRCEATHEKDESKACTAKLFGNSGKSLVISQSTYFNKGYGKCCEMVERHTDLKVCHTEEEVTLLERSPLCRQTIEIQDEAGQEAATEVVMRKKKIKDSKPIHMGLAILQWSKFLFIE